MFRKCLIAVSLAATLCLVSGSARAKAPALTARSAVVLSKDGVVLWEKNPSFTCPPASTTKVLTALVVLDHLSLDSWVGVSRKAEKTEPTRVGIRSGERFRTRDLLYALLMNSGNDVAVCLAEAVSRTESRFAEKMNRKAKKLGALRSVFKKASGLPARGQKTTARDLTLIMRRALKSSTIMDALGTRTKTIRSRAGREVKLRNHNRLLWDRRHDVTLKTGYTRASRHCYVGFFGNGASRGVFAFLMAKKPWDDARALNSFTRRGGAKIAFNKRNLTVTKVKKVQTALSKKGFSPGKPDGIFGPRTLGALEKFQKAKGLKVDGLVGQNTLRSLGLK
jgi:D-alanyl-D-alanine carboxypeptidase (penicillin-binding protein 5/6)